MANLIIEVDDALLSKALIESQDQQVSLDMFINEALALALAEPSLPIRKSVDIETVLQNAVNRVRALTQGDEFLLVDICANEDWNSLSSGERKSLGKDFRKAVEGGASPIAEHVGRTSSNKAIYRRV